MSIFKLPDLGEGLPDAEIVEWLVEEGDPIEVDQPLVSMETAKAVVEVPSPFKGRVLKFYGQAGDVIDTGAPLVEFELEGQEKQAADDAPQPADEEPAQAEQAAGSEDAAAEAAAPEPDGEEREDSGTVVGKMQAGGGILRERTSTVGGVKVTPAVRALARKMKVDLSRVEPSGADNVVTAADVRRAAEEGPADVETETPQPASAPAETTPQPEPAAAAPSRSEERRVGKER